MRFDTVRVSFGSCCALISPTGSLGVHHVDRQSIVMGLGRKISLSDSHAPNN